MSEAESGAGDGRVTRRGALRICALSAGLVWATPVVRSVRPGDADGTPSPSSSSTAPPVCTVTSIDLSDAPVGARMPPDFFADKGVTFIDHPVFPLFIGSIQGDDALVGSVFAAIEGTFSESATSVGATVARAIGEDVDLSLVVFDGQGMEVGREVLHLDLELGYFNLSVSDLPRPAHSFAFGSSAGEFGMSTLSFETCS